MSKERELENILEVEGINAKGFGTIAKIVMLDRRLTIQAKAIYSYFCSYAGGGSTAFPSVSKIMYDLNVSNKTYYKHFNLLVEFGYISVHKRTKSGKFENNIYKIIANPVAVEKTVVEKLPQGKNSIVEKLPHGKNSTRKNSTTNINSSNINSSFNNKQINNIKHNNSKVAVNEGYYDWMNDL